MSNDKNFDSAVLEYLNRKYDAEFKIVKSGMEFNGNDGDYFHAICTSEEYNDEFSVYCYPESEKSGDKITIEEIEYVVLDEYAEVVFQNKILSDIEQLVGKDVFIRCQVEFSDHFISKQEFDTSFETCIGNAELYSHVTVYLVGKTDMDFSKFREQVENYCLNLNPYRGYLYFANATEDLAVVEKHYVNNAEKFDTHINECDEINHVEFSLIKRGEGITKRSIEKEWVYGVLWSGNVYTCSISL